MTTNSLSLGFLSHVLNVCQLAASEGEKISGTRAGSQIVAYMWPVFSASLIDAWRVEMK